MSAALQPSRAPWRGTMGWFLACVATLAIAAASVPVVGWASDVEAPAAIVQAPEAQSARSGERCRSCGVVETVRAVEAAGAPSGYQLTVRFRDGSRRTSSHFDQAGWRVGDSIMLIGEARAGDRT